MTAKGTFFGTQPRGDWKKVTLITATSLIFLWTQSFGQIELSASARAGNAGASGSSKRPQDVVKITGVRFSYPLVQKWIDEFSTSHPDIQVIIESRGSSDPTQYDILIEGYEHPESVRQDREYLYVAQYAVLPITSAKSPFARTYASTGLSREQIIEVFFHDPYADRDKGKPINAPFTIYTRLQKAAAPIVFSSYFGYEQKDIKGKTIAGSDEHLIKALLRDSTGVSFAPVPVIFDHLTKNIVPGISVIPVDLNGNGKVNADESLGQELSVVIQRLGTTDVKDLNNVPFASLHFSVDKKTVTPEALTFLRWVITNADAEKDLKDFGYLEPSDKTPGKEKFQQFAAKHIGQ
jgi:phosphate transport system substrate-binding protein